jgi:HAD superfamily hydrolase (TIGR01662 family)
VTGEQPASDAPHVEYDIVVPTVGRPSLTTLLEALAGGSGPRPGQIVVVDDRRGSGRRRPLLAGDAPDGLGCPVRVLAGPGAGPAAARNVGWRAASAHWIAFLDDDVVPSPDWAEALAADLAVLPRPVAASQGRIDVPLPVGRLPTDWERNVAGLETARWITADMAYRRPVLAEVGGFDERFPRAYREDADLALRVRAAGYRIRPGQRLTRHPVRPAPWWQSVRLQAGNADDVLMEAIHGPGWRTAAGAPRGRLRRHQATTAAGVASIAALAVGTRSLAASAAVAWVAGTGELAKARIAPGPCTAKEVATMVATSVALPVAATWHHLAGRLRLGRLLADTARAPRPASSETAPAHLVAAPDPAVSPVVALRRPAAVLFDRDGTLVRDVPYNGDPALVELMPGAREAVARLRAAGVAVGVVSNQSGVGRGMLTSEQVEAVNRRVEELVGPVDVWVVCPHAPEDGCRCRKPEPGLLLAASARLGLPPEACALVGDIGSDVEAALRAGTRPILVPTSVTLPEEVAAAPEVAVDLADAVDRLLGRGSSGQRPATPAPRAQSAGVGS